MENKELKFQWKNDRNETGTMKFTLDGEKIYYLFKDYPYNMTNEEIEVFDKANPYWANFFKNRKK